MLSATDLLTDAGYMVFGLVAIIVFVEILTAAVKVLWERSTGTPRKVVRLAKLFDVGLPQACITVRNAHHVEALAVEAQARGFHLHDRAGDLLIFRKAEAFQPR